MTMKTFVRCLCGIWFNIMSTMYGHSHVTSLRKGRSLGSHFPPIDETKHPLGSKKDDPPNWFEVEFVKKVETKFQTSFREVTWIENIRLMIRFQRFFTISQRQ